MFNKFVENVLTEDCACMEISQEVYQSHKYHFLRYRFYNWFLKQIHLLGFRTLIQNALNHPATHGTFQNHQ